MGKKKTALIWILTVTLLAGQMPIQAFAQEMPYAQTVSAGDVSEEAADEFVDCVSDGDRAEMANELSVQGVSSFGTILAQEISEETAQQRENNGCNVFSVEMQENTAAVSFESVEDAVLVIGIYDETGKEMLTSGSMEIFAGETTAFVDFEPGSIPQYFYIRGFLVDSLTWRPLCTVYESPMYTREMQEFLAKTTADFETDRVLNLDEDETNNFAVFKEETVLIEGGEGHNDVVSTDETNNRYVIENADNSVTALQQGDIFAYPYTENEVLIVKVQAVEISGTTATITGMETSMEEVFDYVKIDSRMDSSDAVTDTSVCGEGATYEGLVDYVEEDRPQTYATEIEGGTDKAFKWKLDKKYGGIDGLNVEIAGGLEAKFTFSAKIYLSFKTQYVEVKLDYSAKISAQITGKASAEIPLITIGFMFTGIIVELTPSVVIEAEASISLSGTLSGTIGFRAQSGSGMTNITTTPRFKTSLKAEGSIFVGFSLSPRIKILSDKVASASLTARVGAEVSASLKGPLAQEKDKRHTCQVCMAGEINGKFTVSAELKLVNKTRFKITPMDITLKITDFYYSADRDELGWSTCPYFLLKGKVMVRDAGWRPVPDAVIQTPDGEYRTDDKGEAEFWLPAGKSKLTVKKQGFTTENKMFGLENGGEKMLVILYEPGSGGGSMGGRPGEGGDSGNGDDKEYEESFAGGDGTKDNPYQVATAKQLNAVRKDMNACYIQVADIDLNGWNWEPIGNNYYDALEGKACVNPFMGVYDGNGYQILGLTIVRSKRCDNLTIGLFGTSEGQIQNVSVDNCKIEWDFDENEIGSGSLYFMSVGGVVGISSGEVHNCIVSGNISVKDICINVGGIVGRGACSSSTNYANISVVGIQDARWFGTVNCGGIIGDAGDIEECINYGAVIASADTDLHCGGIAGAEKGFISDCINYANVSGELISCRSVPMGMWDCNGGAGGILGTGGLGSSYAVFKNCKNFGNISMQGIGGYICAGGIAGFVDRGQSVRDSYNFGSSIEAVNDNKYSSYSGRAGRIVGILRSDIGGTGYIDNCFSSSTTLVNGVFPVEYIGHNYINGATIELEDKFETLFNESNEMMEMAYSEADIQSEKDSWTGAAFTGLIPKETYNYYVAKTKAADLPFASDNLLYIGQSVADESGTLQVQFTMKDTYADADIFAVPMHLMDLSSAEITVPDLTYDGAGQYAKAMVECNGVTLTEGKDYYLGGDYEVTQPGDYSLTVIGMRLYTGRISVNYKVLSDVYYGTVTGTIAGSGTASVKTTVQLLNDSGDTVARTTVTGNRAEYTLQNVEPGAYTLRADRPNHVTREYTVTITQDGAGTAGGAGMSAVQDVELWLRGDVSGDGKITALDKKLLFNHMAGAAPLSGYALSVGDVSGDGKITALDKKLLFNHMAGTTPLW